MRRWIGALLVMFVGTIVGSGSADAQPATQLQAELLKDWTALKDTMHKIADAMPDDKFSFKATPVQRSYGEQVAHVAQANLGLLRALSGKAVPPTLDLKAVDKASALRTLDASFDYGIALIGEQNDQTLMQAASNPPPFMGPSSRARMITFLMGHTWDIYGQLAVYLRLNGLTPPASQRP